MIGIWKKHDGTTRGIANKGFIGMRRVVARFNFSCTVIGIHPQSLTGHTANRYHNTKKTNPRLHRVSVFSSYSFLRAIFR